MQCGNRFTIRALPAADSQDIAILVNHEVAEAFTGVRN